jgi:hypothetical protein
VFPNAITRRDLQAPSVKEEIRRLSAQYYVGICTHPNLVATLKAICYQKTEETPAIRSTPQIYCIVLVALVMKF